MQPYFQNDLVTLYHGDCLEITEWLEADVLVTDPPYGISYSHNKGAYGPNMKGRNRKQEAVHNAIANDKDAKIRDNALLAWGEKPAVVFGSWKIPRPNLTEHRLIWHKVGMPPGPARAAFMSQDEEIYVWGDGFKKSAPPLRSVIRSEEHRPTAVRQAEHPTPKPIGLMETLISRCPEGVVADPFAGSGSTLIAARNLGRKVIGVELEEKYCEMIATRLSQDAFDFGGI